ncbi:DUF3572 domain-containing protein [Roseobacteraceae bacterium S113]
MALSRESAETLALKALAWLVSSEDLGHVFLNATGASEADLRARVGDPDFLASVLDFLVMDDRWVTDFCDSAGYSYDAPMQARAVLPGGEAMHWT